MKKDKSNIKNIDKDRAHWNSLTDEQKWNNFQLMKKIADHRASVLNKICDHLLGSDWYVVSGDWESVPNEMLADIKRKYPDANYSFHRQLSKIKNIIKEYFVHNFNLS